MEALGGGAVASQKGSPVGGIHKVPNEYIVQPLNY